MNRWQPTISTKEITSATLPLTPKAGRRNTARKANPQPITIPSACFILGISIHCWSLLNKNANSHTERSATTFHMKRPEINVVSVIMFSTALTFMWRAYCINQGRIAGTSATPPKQTRYTIVIHTVVALRRCLISIIVLPFRFANSSCRLMHGSSRAARHPSILHSLPIPG